MFIQPIPFLLLRCDEGAPPAVATFSSLGADKLQPIAPILYREPGVRVG
jgi:hypothetical protein